MKRIVDQNRHDIITVNDILKDRDNLIYCYRTLNEFAVLGKCRFDQAKSGYGWGFMYIARPEAGFKFISDSRVGTIKEAMKTNDVYQLESINEIPNVPIKN